MSPADDAVPPPRPPRMTAFTRGLYVFYVCLGIAGAAGLIEGNQSLLGFWSSMGFVGGGVISAAGLIYAYLTGKWL